VYAHRTVREGLPSDEPVNVLVGYERVEVPAGASVSVRVAVNPDAYRTWDATAHAWRAWDGPVELRVGTHSRDLPFTVEVR
jgi:beta-glucosidase